MVRINNLNEAVASLEKRTTTLERRPVGGNGVSIYVGPDYRGTGPKINVPAVPNPPALPDDLFAPREIPDLIIWIRKDDGRYYKYNPVTQEYTDPSPLLLKQTMTGPTINGWLMVDAEFVNIRSGEKIKDVYFYGNYSGFHWYDGRFYYATNGSSILTDKNTRRSTLHHGNGASYPKFNISDKNGWRVTYYQDGEELFIGNKLPDDVVKKYKIGDRFSYKNVNKEGNIVIMPESENKTYLLSGFDGRELGQYENRVNIAAGMMYLDASSGALLNRDFSFVRYVTPSLYYQSEWVGEHVVSFSNYNGQRALLNINDGTYNCIVPSNGIILDVTM